VHPGPATLSATPAAEFEFSCDFVAALLAEQHPDLANLPVRPLDEGWDNAMFCLGDRLMIRLPRRAAMAHLIRHEQVWLPRLAPQLTLPVPTPCRIGSPTRTYPWHWSIVPWLPGQPAHQQSPAFSEAAALGAFLRSLHVTPPADAPANPFRGVPLSQRASAVEERLQRLASRTNLITTRVKEVWQTGLAAPLDIPSTWLHGDLHPRNILVEQGSLSGIIDWGDIASGDPATDLAAIWMLFADPQAREQACSAYGGVSPATSNRAKAWALLFGLMFLDTGLTDNPASAALGAAILQRVESSPGSDN
jgi:aminoglycoside phosphotransferase (APT) family kinase protein